MGLVLSLIRLLSALIMAPYYFFDDFGLGVVFDKTSELPFTSRVDGGLTKASS